MKININPFTYERIKRGSKSHRGRQVRVLCYVMFTYDKTINFTETTDIAMLSIMFIFRLFVLFVSLLVGLSLLLKQFGASRFFFSGAHFVPPKIGKTLEKTMRCDSVSFRSFPSSRFIFLFFPIAFSLTFQSPAYNNT